MILVIGASACQLQDGAAEKLVHPVKCAQGPETLRKIFLDPGTWPLDADNVDTILLDMTGAASQWMWYLA